MFDTVPDEWVAEYTASLAQSHSHAETPRRGHAPAPRPDDAHTRAATGAVAHYVSTTDRARVLLLVGPFASAREAERWIAPAQDELLRRRQFDLARSVVVTRLLTSPADARPGDLNELFGVRPLG